MSVRSSSRFLGVLALGLVAGCHPAASIAGNVLQTSAGPDVPISDARVTVRCPELGAQTLTATSDGQGAFRLLMEVRFSRECTLEVTHPNYLPASFVLGARCGETDDEASAGYCPVRSRIVIRLEPTP